MNGLSLLDNTKKNIHVFFRNRILHHTMIDKHTYEVLDWDDIQLDIDDGNGKQIGSNTSLSCIGGRIEVSLIRFSLTRGWSGLSSSLTRWSWLGGSSSQLSCSSR